MGQTRAAAAPAGGKTRLSLKFVSNGNTVMTIGESTQHDETVRLDSAALREVVERKWNDEIVPALTDYIAVPAKSPMFDSDWARHGFIERVVTDAVDWIKTQPVKGLTVEIVRLP